MPPPVTPWRNRPDQCNPGEYNLRHSGCAACEPGTESVVSDATTGLRTCKSCPAGKLQWRYNQTECIPCSGMTGVVCEHDCRQKPRASFEPTLFYVCNDEVKLLPDYYRADDAKAHPDWTLEELATPARCPMRSACVGGNGTGSALCNEGHSGHLCGTCAPGRYRSFNQGCLECPEDANTPIYVMSAVGVAIALLIVLTFSHQHQSKHRTQSRKWSRSRGKTIQSVQQGWLGSGWCGVMRLVTQQLRVHRVEISTYVKILLGFVQVMGAFRRFEFVKWPPMFNTLLQYLDISFPIDLVPFDCVAKRTLTFYDMLAGFLVLPFLGSFALFVLAFVTWVLSSLTQPADGPSGCAGLRMLWGSPTMWLLHLWMLLVLYPLLCSQTFATFDCVEVKAEGPQPIRLLRADPSLECDTELWRTYRAVAVISVIVYGIGIPALFFVMARRYAAIRGVPGKVVDARRWRLRANLLLWSYKHSFWYAECFDLVRKLLLASVVLEVAKGTRIQLAFGALISLAALPIYVHTQPYRSIGCQQVSMRPQPRAASPACP